jgi:Tol biopolymer transport system component
MKTYSFKISLGISILVILAACPPPIPQPDISVSTSGTTILSGESYDFKIVSLGTSKTVTFVIKNGGAANLELTGSPEKVRVTGTDASLFSVNSQPSSPIAPGASQTFTVTFSPLTNGSKTAALTIPCNDPDPDESTYRFKLTGCGDKCYDDAAVNLTNDSTTDDRNPAVSPDGGTLLFSSKKRNVPGDAKYIVRTMDLLTRQVTPLTKEQDGDNITMPGSSWNKTTNKICFTSNRDDNDEIYTMDPDGNNLYRVTHYPTAQDQQPTFSPDGTLITFQSDKYRGWEIYTIDVESLDTGTLTNTSEDNLKPNWSPLGDKIVFQSNRNGNWEIYTMNADGTGQTNITNDPAAEDTDPSWSPDGTKIVYASTHGGLAAPEIFVINADGSGEPEQITDYAGYDGAPSFSLPDGKWIYFESDRDGNLDIWRIPYTGNSS